ncbi:MAG: hypothetical protein IJR40_08040 [Treponema sp.]|nr:hypothetical protein [Treponema sp.]
MKRIIQIIFITCAILALSLPILKFNRSGSISERENRTLAAKPNLFKENRFNKNFFSECDAYFTDRFGGRNILISINNAINKTLHAVVANDLAIKGKDGWLYYINANDGNNLSDFLKTNLMSKEDLLDFKRRTNEAIAWCEANGIKCIFLICPNKHSIYPENYIFARPEGVTRADQITKVFDELDAPYFFTRDYLISKKSEYNFPLYYETDTHWNPHAAYLVSQLMREKIQNYFPNINFPQIEYERKIDYSMTMGDILPMLKIKEAKSTQVTLSPARQKIDNFYTYIKYEGRNGVHTKSADSTLPRALIFRDSFFSALEPFVSPFFSEAEYHWRQFSEADKDYVLQYKPDIIIFEAVERGATTIVQ